MKRNKSLSCAAAILLMGLAACTKNEDVPNVAPADENRYLRVSIADVNTGTRADFDPGTAEENDISYIRLDFYDIAGKLIYTAYPSDMTYAPGNSGDGNVGNTISRIVKVEISKDQPYPSYVICFLNPVQYGQGDSRDMTDLRTAERDKYKNANGDFAMCNSVYFGTDAATGVRDVKISGTPIVPGQLFNSQAEAEAATGDKILNIYVERYAAKVKFSCTTTAATGEFDKETASGIYPTTVGDYTLSFIPEKWTVNADSKSMFAIKNFTEPEDQASSRIQEASKNFVDDMLTGWDDWNDEDNHRCYWSCTPSFYAKDFPQVSDDVNFGNETLKYYSYNEVMKGKDKDGKDISGGMDATSEGNVKYVLENTVGENALKSLNPKAAVPSILLVGKYKVTKGADEVTLGDDEAFYKLGNALYFDNANHGKLSMKDHFLEQQMIVFQKNGEKYELVKNTSNNTLKSRFTIQHPEGNVREGKSVPMRYVTLQLTNTSGTPLYFSAPGSGSNEYTQITEANLDIVNRLLWQQVGIAEAYYEGICYYSIPIRHLGFGRSATTTPTDENGNIKWSDLRIGDLGLVRNHVYDLQVKAINGLATGVSDPTEPIVPPMEQDEYYIKYNINILNWRIVPPQTGIIL